MPDARKVGQSIDAIEAELKKLGWWSAIPLPEEVFADMGAFGQNTMSFSQWLQFVFVPSVRRSIASGDFPNGSQVGAKAVREFDGILEADRLVSLLSEFDALFE